MSIQITSARVFTIGSAVILSTLCGCRTLSNSQAGDDASVQATSGDMLSESQWSDICNKALEETPPEAKDKARADLHDIAQTSDCQEAYGAVKKTIKEAFKSPAK